MKPESTNAEGVWGTAIASRLNARQTWGIALASFAKRSASHPAKTGFQQAA